MKNRLILEFNNIYIDCKCGLLKKQNASNFLKNIIITLNREYTILECAQCGATIKITKETGDE